jgi:hypothetical protein
VLKFRGRTDLCPWQKSAKQLRDRRTCLEWCDFSACRANMNRKYGGSKTYWTDAPFPLLTHKAYETHAVLKPALNRFDAVVFDELPAIVYRYPKLSVSAAAVVNGRAIGWSVTYLDNLISVAERYLEALDPNDDDGQKLRAVAEPMLADLQCASKRLKAKASDLMHKAQAGEMKRRMAQVDRMEPVLSRAAFSKLAAVLADAAADVDPDESADGDTADPAMKLLNELTVLHDFCGDAPFDVFMEVDFDHDGKGALRIWRPVNGWPDLLNQPDGQARSTTILLDGTAGIDPRYLLAGQWDVEEVPDGEFPNTTVVLTSEKSVTKSRVKEQGAVELAETIVERVAPYLGQMVDLAYTMRAKGPPRLLVVTAKGEMKIPLRHALAPYQDTGRLAAEVAVEHFGGLRGRNDFRDYDAVFLTHVHRYDAAYYYGLELLLRDFGGFDRQWVPISKWNLEHSVALTHRAMASDIYQDVLRIGIRSDPSRRSFIFLPTEEAGLVVRVLRMFRGARLILQDGEQVLSPLPAAAPTTAEPAVTPDQKEPPASRWGMPKHV